jgi:hypothetical protein
MRSRPRDLAAAALLALAALWAADAAAQSSPLSRSFSTPSLGGSTQVPSLWYYGPSYSLNYDKAPPGGAGPTYRASLHFDPYYGPDYQERLERGHRFGPLAPWPHRFNDR